MYRKMDGRYERRPGKGYNNVETVVHAYNQRWYYHHRIPSILSHSHSNFTNTHESYLHSSR